MASRKRKGGSWISAQGAPVSQTRLTNWYTSGAPWGYPINYGTTEYDLLYSHAHQSARTPGYGTMKDWQLPMNPFSSHSAVVYDDGCNVSQPWGASNPQRYSTWVGSNKLFFPTFYDAVKDAWRTADSMPLIIKTQQGCLSKVSNQKINVAQAFAERKQTASLLVDSVNRLAQFALAVKKGNLERMKSLIRGRPKFFQSLTSSEEIVHKFPKQWKTRVFLSNRERLAYYRDNFANHWLEYSYGWRPLVSDIYGASELMAQVSLNERPTKVTVFSEEVKASQFYFNSNGITALVERMETVRALTSMRFSVEEAWVQDMQRTGLSNPALLAWELLPYSFVVDWVLPIGNYLKKAFATQGLKFVDGFSSATNVVTAKSSHVENNASYTGEFNGCRMRAVFMDRLVLTDFPSAKLPSFQPPSFLSQAVSALALLNQLFHRR